MIITKIFNKFIFTFIILSLSIFNLNSNDLFYSGNKRITFKKNEILTNNTNTVPKIEQSFDFRMIGKVSSKINSNIDINSLEGRNIVNFSGMSNNRSFWQVGTQQLISTHQHFFYKKDIIGFSFKNKKYSSYIGSTEGITLRKKIISNGTNGPYFISEDPISENSEIVYVDYIKLKKNINYSIDNENGILFFTDPILAGKEIIIYFQNTKKGKQTIFGTNFKLSKNTSFELNANKDSSTLNDPKNRFIFSMQNKFNYGNWNNILDYSFSYIDNTKSNIINKGAGISHLINKQTNNFYISMLNSFSEKDFFSEKEELNIPFFQNIIIKNKLAENTILKTETFYLKGNNTNTKIISSSLKNKEKEFKYERKLNDKDIVSNYIFKFNKRKGKNYISLENNLQKGNIDQFTGAKNSFDIKSKKYLSKNFYSYITAKNNILHNGNETTNNWNSIIINNFSLNKYIDLKITGNLEKTDPKKFIRSFLKGFKFKLSKFYAEISNGKKFHYFDDIPVYHNIITGNIKYKIGKNYFILKKTNYTGDELGKKSLTDIGIALNIKKIFSKTNISFNNENKIITQNLKFRINSIFKFKYGIKWEYNNNILENNDSNIEILQNTSFGNTKLSFNISNNIKENIGMLDSELSFEFKL